MTEETTVPHMGPERCCQVLAALAAEHEVLADLHAGRVREVHHGLQGVAKESPDKLGSQIDDAYERALRHRQLAEHHNEIWQALALAETIIKDAGRVTPGIGEHRGDNHG